MRCGSFAAFASGARSPSSGEGEVMSRPTSHASTRLPAETASRASAAANTVFPVPPFPVTTINRREKRAERSASEGGAGAGRVTLEPYFIAAPGTIAGSRCTVGQFQAAPRISAAAPFTRTSRREAQT